MARKLPTLQLVRRISLGVFLAVVTVLTILHQKLVGFPSIDSLCPFGGVETFYKYLAGGELIKKIMPSNIVLLVGTVLLAILVGRFFCGWLCALGALQGVFGWIGKKLFGKPRTVPASVDRYLRLIKYPLLVFILYMTWTTGTLFIRPYDPFAAYGHLAAGLKEVWGEFAIGLVILVASLLLSMLYERAFCKYLCPLGAFNAILGKIPLFRIRREASTCISCSKCDKVCPMNIDVSHPKAVESMECIGCMECVSTCPTKRNTLYTTFAGKKFKLGTVVIAGLAIYLGTLAVGQVLGKLDFAGPSLSQLALEGKIKVEDIKGSSTWQEVADTFGVELERLYREAGVDGSKVPADTKLKDTGGILGIEFEADAARVAVAKILGIPYAGEGGTLPAEAGAASEPVMSSGETSTTVAAAGEAVPAASSAAPKSATPATTVPAAKPAASAAPKPAATSPAPAATTPAAPVAPAAPAAAAGSGALVVPADFALEGTMTIAQVASALKASEAQVIAKLGLPADIAVDKPLRDMKDQYGYTMPALKEKIKQ